LADTTAIEASALTVAGQWRSFTAFPSILAITVVSYTARSVSSEDGIDKFHAMNGYKRTALWSQKRVCERRSGIREPMGGAHLLIGILPAKSSRTQVTGRPD
jgi:hypothetical protein